MRVFLTPRIRDDLPERERIYAETLINSFDNEARARAVHDDWIAHNREPKHPWPLHCGYAFQKAMQGIPPTQQKVLREVIDFNR